MTPRSSIRCVDFGYGSITKEEKQVTLHTGQYTRRVLGYPLLGAFQEPTGDLLECVLRTISGNPFLRLRF